MFKPEWLVFLNLHYSKRTETANYTVVDFFRTNLEANNEKKKKKPRPDSISLYTESFTFPQ